MLNTWAELTTLYTECLTHAHEQSPREYLWPKSHLPVVVQKMVEGFKTGSYNHDGAAIKLLAKKLGVKPTRTELNKAFRSLV